MKKRSSVFIATSLDGFIARKDGGLDWLDEANETVPEGEDCGYNSFMKSVDILIMGRNTYEKVLSFGKWPYESKPVIVMSSKAIKISSALAQTVSHSSESPEILCNRLFKEGKEHLYIDGGNTIQRFLAAGMVSELTVTIIPVIIGNGIPLFNHENKDIMLKRIKTKSYEFGFNQLSYEVENNITE